MGRHSTKSVNGPLLLVESHGSLKRKRKRDEEAEPEENIEVDVSAPEPLSKKAQRRARKTGRTDSVTVNRSPDEVEAINSTGRESPPQQAGKPKEESQRTAFGIWIGNLPWSVNKSDLVEFLTHENQISRDAIARVHLPPPSKAAKAANEHVAAARNKGFAYVDFADQATLDVAISLSNTFLGDRRVLIKKSSDFEGRPEITASKQNQSRPSNPPNNKIWIGNLGFDVTGEDLKTHYSQCGKIVHLHMATFQESGRCKGYAWLEFEALEAAKAAVTGYILKEQDKEESLGYDVDREKYTQAKQGRPRKWWVNKLFGRTLQVQFAESESNRYKKRFGKTAKDVQLEQEAEREGKPSLSTKHSPRDQGSGRKRNPLGHINVSNQRDAASALSLPRAQPSNDQSKGKKTLLD